MENRKIFLVEKILLGLLLAGSLVGYWYFEENLILRIVVLILSLYSLYLVFSKKPKSEHFSSRQELVVLLILYLGVLTLYNLLYGLNIPLYVIMAAILILTSLLFFSIFSLDKVDAILGKSVFRALILLMGIIVLQVFLSLYFWPIDPTIKTLILVVIFYLTISLVYLYIHSMLRLKRVAGYLVVSLVILGMLMLVTWLGLSK